MSRMAQGAPRPPPEWDLLLSSAQKNKPEKIRKLIVEESVDPCHSNHVGQSALHVAALWCHVESVQVLMELGADPLAQNQMTGATPLHCIVQAGRGNLQQQIDTIKLLLREQEKRQRQDPQTTQTSLLSQPDFFGKIPHDYSNEAPQQIQDLLKPQKPKIFLLLDSILASQSQEGADNNDTRASATKEFQHLLEQDADIVVNQRYLNKSPLSLLIDKLCGNGNDDDDDDEEFNDVPTTKTAVEYIKILLKHGADPNNLTFSDKPGSDVHLFPHPPAQDKEDTSVQPSALALHQVCVALKDAHQTLQRQSDSEKEKDQTIATIATCLQDVALQLKQRKAEMHPQTLLLLHDAARRDMLTLVDFFLNGLNMPVNTRGRQGMTALQFAARSGKIDMVKLLLSNPQIDVTIQDDRGKSALDAAKVNNKTEIVELLQKQTN